MKGVVWAASGFVAGTLAGLAGRRRRRRSRGRLNRRAIAGCEDVFPVAIAPFRALVRLAGERKAAALSARLGRPLRFTAQDGEDMLLAELFGYRSDGVYVEIGAYNGVHLSNTFFFEQLGWGGLLVEPLPEQAAACGRNRPGSKVIAGAVGRAPRDDVVLTEVIGADGGRDGVFSFIGDAPPPGLKPLRPQQQTRTHRVTLQPFETLAAAWGHAGSVDFISIDCEGMDFEVLQTIDLARRRPRILVIEHVTNDLVAYLAGHEYAPMLRIRANTLFSREPADRAVLSRDGFWRALGVLPPTPGSETADMTSL